MIRLPKIQDIKYTDSGRYALNWVTLDFSGRIIGKRRFFRSYTTALIEFKIILKSVKEAIND